MNTIEDKLAEFEKNGKKKSSSHRKNEGAGTIRNVIADKCVLEGTHRSLPQNPSQNINILIRGEYEHELIARNTNTRSEVKFLASYDPVINNPEETS